MTWKKIRSEFQKCILMTHETDFILILPEIAQLWLFSLIKIACFGN